MAPGSLRDSLAQLPGQPQQRSRPSWPVARLLAGASALLVIAVAVGIAGLSTGSPAPSSTAIGSTSASVLPSPVDLAAGLPYFCGNGEVFDVQSLSGPANAEMGADPASAPVQSLAISHGLAARHWWLVFRSATEAEFIGRTPSGGYEFIVTEIRGGTTWGFKGLGDCQVKYLGAGLSTLTWWIDPSRSPSVIDREVRVIATDPCQPATLAGRVGNAVIRYGAEAILIVLTATPGEATGDVCLGGAGYELTVRLDEPIGSRVLIDGGTWPGRDARLPSPT
jgi:hypothetical protein